MLIVMMAILGILGMVLTEVFVLFPSRVFSGIQLPQWMSLLLILIVLSWCMEDGTK